MQEYIHVVQYYETDKMGVTHHSNYIRWMEEARVSYSNTSTYNYKALEADGIISPVTEVMCKYISTSTFGDTIRIEMKIKSYTGVKLEFIYNMYNQENELVCVGESHHCFIKNGKIISLKREKPELDQEFRNEASK